MKTFEERYTAWIDGQLDGPALTAFELELSRRASAGEARADRSDADRLRQLLTTHLRAPVMTNTEFFSHQLRERIEADRRANERRREPARASRMPFFAWSFGQLAGLGAAFLFVAAALYYGLVPPHIPSAGPVARVPVLPSSGGAVAVNDPPVPQPSAPTTERKSPDGPIELVNRSPLPPAIDEAPQDIQKVQVPDQSKPTTATPLHYQKPDVNVIWINGLDYMPSVPGEPPAPVATAQP